jgi:hypothetical protein
MENKACWQSKASKLPEVNRKDHGGYCLLSLATVTFQDFF